MPKVVGIFDIFDELDQLPIDDIAKWLNNKLYTQSYLDNYLANRILYPQVAPISENDLNIDLAILREILKRHPEFFDAKENKLLIPTAFTERFTNLPKLVWSFVDSYRPQDITTVVVDTDGGQEVVGSVITPKFTKATGLCELIIEDKKYSLKPGTLTIIPYLKNSCQVIFKSDSATVSGKSDLTFDAAGGKLGIMLDARNI